MKMSVDQALRKARSLSPAEAEALFREILERFPANKRVQAELQHLARPKIVPAPAEDLEAVVALYRQGRLTQALDKAADVLTRFPHSEILHNITGAIHMALGRQDPAIRHFDKALELAPDYFEAWNNRGNALNDQQRPEDAIASFDAALKLNPGFAEAHMNRGIALRKLKRLEESVASYDRAIRLAPGCAEAYNNRGNTLAAQNRAVEALADYEQAVALKPVYADALVNRGNILRMMKRPADAVLSYDHAIAIAPAHVEAHNQRGSALRDLKRFDEALASHEAALRLAPGNASVASEVRNLRAHMCLWDDDALIPLLGEGGPVSPFYRLGFEDSPKRQLDGARAWSAKEFGPGRPASFRPRAANARIRLGYFSADFHGHATMQLMARLFELHDRSRFEIHVFSWGPDVQDDMRRRLLDSVDAFHPVAHLGDAAVAALARSTSIDIAIDLKGHTQDSRSGIFAHRAAPVQVAHVGYPGTMGADFIDYIVADRVTIPVADQAFYTEKVAYLPNSYQPNDDRREIADRDFTRAELGLPENGFVFCCFNNNYKIKRAEFDIWMRLLGQVEGSVLWLLEDNCWVAANLRREAEARAIAADRLVFAGRMPFAEHLARHRQADLFLDTFDVNAHTTASDALWCGLPVITKAGAGFAARVAASLLTAIDLPDLVTMTAAAYEQRALQLATDPAELQSVRSRLADNRLTSPLFDTARYTRDLETLYQGLIR